MAKALQNAVMTRSRLKSVSLKNQNTTDWNYNKYQRILCTNLLQKTNFYYFCNFNVQDLNDKKKSGKKIKPFFSEKCFESSNIVLKKMEI